MRKRRCKYFIYSLFNIFCSNVKTLDGYDYIMDNGKMILEAIAFKLIWKLKNDSPEVNLFLYLKDFWAKVIMEITQIIYLFNFISVLACSSSYDNKSTVPPSTYKFLYKCLVMLWEKWPDNCRRPNIAMYHLYPFFIVILWEFCQQQGLES